MEVHRYLVELRRPDDGWGDVRAMTDGVRRAVAGMQATGAPVRFLRSVYVPEDETCFLLLEGASADDVGRVAEASGVDLGSITAALGGRATAPLGAGAHHGDLHSERGER
jgi:hypothetical protein